MNKDIEKVLITEEAIGRRLDEVAQRIIADFSNQDSLQVVAILKGSVFFMADLLRRIPFKIEIECLNVSSYHGGTKSSGQVDFLDQKLPDVRRRCVLVVDDILDTGQTLGEVKAKLTQLGASEVKTCVLISKKKERVCDRKADYAAFEIDDEFVVGYGLDYRGQYRNLPYVGVLKSSLVS
jgi:hypoxanthine phosphoribosyltransferase